jgi:hypothetical protein
MNINTTSQMIRAIATAINDGDIETLYDCRQINDDWMQTNEERDAMNELIQAAINTVE